MTDALLRNAFDTLLGEAFEGPPDPKQTWVVTNAPDSGVLGTIKHLTAEQAWHRPPGLQHSVAEHIAHVLFQLNLAHRRAVEGGRIEGDWDSSWHAGEMSDLQWQHLQRQLHEAHLRLRMWVHSNEAFASQESVTTFLSTVAHSAYHLGAIRQLAALAVAQTPAEDPTLASAKPL